MFRRYAIYITPDGPLGAAGARWLGWDIAAGSGVEHATVSGIDVAAITQRPRKYGFHATVKPPMRLLEGCTSEELMRAAGALARSAAPVSLDGLAVTRLGGFLALTALGDTAPLDALAAQVVDALDPFRAPPAPEELARRRNNALTPSQEQNLTRWGYPHVMQDYRFHITLTGRLKNPDAIASLVAAHFAPVLPVPYLIDHLTLVGEAEDGMFHAIARLPLGG